MKLAVCVSQLTLSAILLERGRKVTGISKFVFCVSSAKWIIIKNPEHAIRTIHPLRSNDHTGWCRLLLFSGGFALIQPILSG